MIRVENVTQRFAGRIVLNAINLRISERRIAVIGCNGSGKSTFVRLLNGLLLPDQGAVAVADLDTRKNIRQVRRKVGFVFQNPDLQIVFPTVEEDLAFGLKNLKLDKDEIQRRIDSTLNYYRLTHLRHQSTHLLSGGEKQLLAISSVLVMEPEIIVFDEPTTLLDLRNKKKIHAVLDALKQHIVVVTHDLEAIAHYDRVLVFDQGKVVMDAAPERAVSFYQELMA